DRDGTEIRGSVNGHEGHMEFMGNEWTFDHGGLTFDEAAPTGRFDLWFRRLGHLQANREVAPDSWDDPRSQLRLHGPLRENRIDLYGPGGSTMADSGSFHTANHALWTSGPDMPGSETV